MALTEGQRTEVLYLQGWARRFKDTSLLIDPEHGMPKTLVQLAVERKKRAIREAKRGRGASYDEIWCVFDVDRHPNLAEALDQAAQAGIGVALTNPCLELWFVLHFQDWTRHLERGEAQSLSKKLLHCGKHLTSDAVASLLDRYEEATTRAKSLDAKHLGDGSGGFANPSSSVWKLVESIRSGTR